MPSLFDEMTQYLHRWRDELPTAWCGRLDSVEPNFDAIPRNVLIDRDARIVPARRNRGGVFHALEGIDPSNVVAIVIGNDPYPDPCRATGRSFEQGDLTDWNDDLAEPGRVTPSLLSLVCAFAALLPDAEGLGLDRGDLANRREKLLCGLRNGQVVLPSPWTMFENLTGQGVLWLNRTLTISAVDTGTRRRGSSWRAIKNSESCIAHYGVLSRTPSFPRWWRKRGEDLSSLRCSAARPKTSGNASKPKADVGASQGQIFAS